MEALKDDERITRVLKNLAGEVGVEPREQDSIQQILNERAKTHGSFEDHAYFTQTMKRIIANDKFNTLNDRHKEALHMILHKIGRIMAGNPNHQDHWDDIAGYAKLGSEACK